MKKLLGLLLTLFMSLTLFACDKKEKKTTKLVKDGEWKTPAQLLAEYQKENKKVSVVKMSLKFTDDDGLKYVGYMSFVLFNDFSNVTSTNCSSTFTDREFSSLFKCD